jgi:glycosyltransferase involved in cell wall biosynthesis
MTPATGAALPGDDADRVPTVSVCIPVFNTERFIATAIKSALAQTFTDFELVVVDNASTDATSRIIEGFADPRMRFFRNAANIGPAANFNRAVSLARGRYLKVLCADDVLYPDCLEKQVAVFEGDVRREIALVSSARDIIDGRGKHWLRRRFPGGGGRISSPAAVRKTVRSGTNIFGEPAAVLVRTAAVKAAGAFDPRFGFCLDLDLWCRLLQDGDLHMLDDALCGFRISNQSWSAALAAHQQQEFSQFIAELSRRGVPLSSVDRALGRVRAWLNAMLRQTVTRVLLLTSRT